MTPFPARLGLFLVFLGTCLASSACTASNRAAPRADAPDLRDEDRVVSDCADISADTFGRNS